MSELTLRELGGTLKRVLPFRAGDSGRELTRHLWVESCDGKVSFTTTNGFVLAQVSVSLDWPDGQWLVDGPTVERQLVSHRAEKVADLIVGDGTLIIAEVPIPVVGDSWLDYSSVLLDVQEKVNSCLLTDRKSFARVLRESKGDIIGVSLADGQARLVVATHDRRDYSLETTGVGTLPCQMVQGEGRGAFNRETLSKLVRAAGDWVSLKFQPEGEQPSPALMEGPNFLALVVTSHPFPRETYLSQQQRQLLEWAEEMLASVRKGEVLARVEVSSRSFTITWSPEPPQTEVSFPDETKVDA